MNIQLKKKRRIIHFISVFDIFFIINENSKSNFLIKLTKKVSSDNIFLFDFTKINKY
jgi:hypothetical protein